jgi:hypothetical protein
VCVYCVYVYCVCVCFFFFCVSSFCVSVVLSSHCDDYVCACVHVREGVCVYTCADLTITSVFLHSPLYTLNLFIWRSLISYIYIYISLSHVTAHPGELCRLHTVRAYGQIQQHFVCPHHTTPTIPSSTGQYDLAGESQLILRAPPLQQSTVIARVSGVKHLFLRYDEQQGQFSGKATLEIDDGRCVYPTMCGCG